MLTKTAPHEKLWLPDETLTRQLDDAPKGANDLWGADPDLLLEDFGEPVREILSSVPETAPALVVPINNGARWMPAFSIAAARSGLGLNVVGGLNGEITDSTEEVADYLGWRTTYRSHGSIASGFIAGLQFVRENLPNAGVDPETGVQTVMKTDVDTLIAPTYAESTLKCVQDIGKACVVFGALYFKGGLESETPSMWERAMQATTNLERDGMVQGLQLLARLGIKQVGARGAATTVGLDPEGEFSEALENMEDDLCEDRNIRKIAQDRDLPVVANLDFRNGYVVTWGNRYHNPLVYTGVHLGSKAAQRRFSNDGIGDVTDNTKVYPV